MSSDNIAKRTCDLCGNVVPANEFCSKENGGCGANFLHQYTYVPLRQTEELRIDLSGSLNALKSITGEFKSQSVNYQYLFL